MVLFYYPFRHLHHETLQIYKNIVVKTEKNFIEIFPLIRRFETKNICNYNNKIDERHCLVNKLVMDINLLEF